MTITPEQKLALAEAGEAPLELADPKNGDAFILVRAETYRRLVEEAEDHREHEAWGKVGRKARDQLASENSY